MKKASGKITVIKPTVEKKVIEERKALEKKVQEGARKAVKEYKQVFERLAAYDRT